MSPLGGVNRVYRILFACITLPASCSCPAQEDTAVARRAPPFNPQLAFLAIRRAFCRTRSALRPSSPKARLIRGSTSDPCIPFATAIFPIAAAAAVQIGEALHQLDAHDVSSSCSRDAPKSVDINPLIVLEVGAGVVAVVEFC